MRVLFAVDSLAPGGTETSTVLLAPKLRELGVDFSIATLTRAEHDLTDFARASGVPVQPLTATSFRTQVVELHELIRSERPDVLHTALFKADQVGRLASIRTDTTVVSSLVNTPYVRERLNDPNVIRWKLRVAQVLDALTARLFVDWFHAVSEGVKAENARALHLRPSDVLVAERGRDVATLGTNDPVRRRRVRTALGLPDDVPVILNIGRQEYQKGQLDLVGASRVLCEHGRDHRVLVAGKRGNASGALAADLDDDRDTSPPVQLLGQRDDIGDLLAAADVLVVSSHFEGTAGAALEAMAMGTPIVSTDLAGTRGILEHERNALLVPVARPSEIARAVERLLDDPVLAARLAAKGRADFEERFTLDRAATAMAEFYRRVLGQPD